MELFNDVNWLCVQVASIAFEWQKGFKYTLVGTDWYDTLNLNAYLYVKLNIFQWKKNQQNTVEPLLSLKRQMIDSVLFHRVAVMKSIHFDDVVRTYIDRIPYHRS